MTDINCDAPTAVLSGAVLSGAVLADAVVTAAAWSARTGAARPRPAFPGTSVSGTGAATGLAGRGLVGTVRPVAHVRPKAAAVSLAGAVMALDGQTNNYIQMTSVFASGEGASGPPPDREPA